MHPLYPINEKGFPVFKIAVDSDEAEIAIIIIDTYIRHSEKSIKKILKRLEKKDTPKNRARAKEDFEAIRESIDVAESIRQRIVYHLNWVRDIKEQELKRTVVITGDPIVATPVDDS